MTEVSVNRVVIGVLVIYPMLCKEPDERGQGVTANVSVDLYTMRVLKPPLAQLLVSLWSMNFPKLVD